MQKNKVLKQLLAVSAVASMFAAFQVHAQVNNTPSVQELNQANSGRTNMDGKTAWDGTVGNTGSQGMDERTNVRYTQGTEGSTAAGTSATQGETGAGASHSHSGMHDSTASAASTAGVTTAASTADMTDQSSTGASTTGTTGSSGQDTTGQSSTGASTTGATGSSGQEMTGQTSSGAAAAGQAAASGSGKLSKGDQRIVMDMAHANIAEIEAGKLALSKSQDDNVKAFAQQMIDDHGKALAEVEALAKERGLTLPTEPDKKHKAMAAKLEKLSGDAFNREYMKQAGVSDHKKVYALLQKHHKNAKDPEVKDLAGKMLPTVEQHLKSAQQMASAKNGTTSGK
jgi:putative membrane protein